MNNPLRRKLLRGAAAALLGIAAGHSFARSGRKARLGMLYLEPVASEDVARHPATVRLAELGWIEGRNLSVNHVFANADRSALPRACASVLDGRPDVLWTDEFDSALELSRRTRTVPIVFCGTAQPVEQGLIESYARPGRNLTGVAHITGLEVTIKRVHLLNEIVPAARRLAWIYPSWGLQSAAGKQIDMGPYEAEARKAGFDTAFYPVGSIEDLDAAFKAIRDRRTEALTCGSNPFLILTRRRIIAFANSNHIPSTYLEAPFVQAGGLLSFGPDRNDVRRKTGDLIDHILKGANPAFTPVEQPRKFVTAVNMRTAKSLGLSIPSSILLQADLVIE